MKQNFLRAVIAMLLCTIVGSSCTTIPASCPEEPQAPVSLCRRAANSASTPTDLTPDLQRTFDAIEKAYKQLLLDFQKSFNEARTD